MPDWTVDELVAPVAQASPCGEALDYDADRLALDRLLEADPIDARGVQQLALRLLARSKDLALAVALTRAATGLRGLAGCTDGLALLDALLRRYPEQLHPQLDEEGATWRANTLHPLQAPGVLPRELARAAGEGDAEARAALGAQLEALAQTWAQLHPEHALDLQPLRAAARLHPGGPLGQALSAGDPIRRDPQGAWQALQRALAWRDAR